MKKILFIYCLLVSTLCLSAQDKVKFVLFADIHYDIMPDADQRLDAIIRHAEKQNADFILELGDFIPAKQEYNVVRDRINACPIPMYHTLGNHDIDRVDKKTYMEYWRIPSSYYFFDKGKFRFIVLDSDFFIDKDGVLKSYDKGNYAKVEEEDRNRYSREELTWLKGLLADSSHICILFSHAPVNDQYATVSQNKELHEILVQARTKGTKIAMVFGGHMHSDNYHLIDDINYMQVNGASNIWGGSKFVNTERYPDSLYRKYPSLKYVIPYDRALYATVEVDAKGTIKITGVKGKYVKPEPDKELLKTKPYPCSPVVSSLKLTF